MATVVLVWQWRHPPHPPAAVTDGGSRLPELPAAAPLEPFQLSPLEQYGEVMARPLFIAARRPESPPEETAPEPPPAGPERTFVLLGVMMTREATTVLLRPEEPNAKTARIKPGETIGEWRLETVSADRVVLRKGEATQELPLVRPRTPSGPRPTRRPAGPARIVPPAMGQPAPVMTPQTAAPSTQIPAPPKN
ncbi:MAG: hypothetical protein R6X17_15110 [Candidatus Competibacteraceae bacterium]